MDLIDVADVFVLSTRPSSSVIVVIKVVFTNKLVFCHGAGLVCVHRYQQVCGMSVCCV
jgi:hypothetical protein